MTRTLFLGLDGATFHILDDLTCARPGQDVVMPFLGQFMAQGFRAPLRSTPHPLTPPAWTTLVTGRNPGEHGVYDFMRVDDRQHEVFFTLYDFRDIRCETIWNIAERQNRSVVSLNFPMMAPPPKLNGSLIPGFTPWKHLRRNMTPDTLYERLQAIPGFHPRELAWDFERENEVGNDMDEDYLADWIRYHLPREELWFKVACKLLVEDQPALLAILFDGVDKIQHQAWYYLDPALRPAQPDAAYWMLRNLCLDYFHRLDGYLAELTRLAGSDVQVFMASDHGFTGSGRVVRINRYLADLGYLVYQALDGTAAAQRRASSPFAYLDWEKTVAYCPTPSSNAILIRVAREPGQPGVAPGDYLAFRAQLIEQLYALRDPATGEPVIRDILTREAAFPGQASANAPDLTLILADHGFVSIRNLEPTVFTRPRPVGTHHPDGIVLASGPGIQPGWHREPLPIADVAATLLHSLDLPIPADFDGQVITSAFTIDSLRNRPVHSGSTTRPVKDGAVQEDAIPAEDRDKILAQLAMLGYLEE
ncbi:MAG: alkaline phosphatase family protein [Gammaproteobacteria bacterium]|nr:alkaline phosphatase family protein [Gammaproteobacteria bacterium]MCP5195299.1 alkaline phosphatase family protein [Gammaproteobacteria bacterium]